MILIPSFIFKGFCFTSYNPNDVRVGVLGWHYNNRRKTLHLLFHITFHAKITSKHCKKYHHQNRKFASYIERQYLKQLSFGLICTGGISILNVMKWWKWWSFMVKINYPAWATNLWVYTYGTQRIWGLK